MSKATSHGTIICYNKKMIQHDLLYDYSMRIRYIIISHPDAADDARHISSSYCIYTLLTDHSLQHPFQAAESIRSFVYDPIVAET